jgi:hypothetical protein
MTRREIKTIYDPTRMRRVIILRRADGSFGFEDQRFCDEQCWIPYGHYSESFCDTAERAESEASLRVSWLN